MRCRVNFLGREKHLDKTNSTLEAGKRQDFRGAANSPETQSDEISRADRRLLLGASLRLLARRFSVGQPISQDDVIRAASLADDAMGQAA